ncbi:MAG: OmpA family protein, partial [Duodenibacillus sp.]|nr:OmpA family protein [Duodenibacillus sp.]
YLANVSDLMCALLFIFVIVLCIAVIRLQRAQADHEAAKAQLLELRLSKQETLRLQERIRQQQMRLEALQTASLSEKPLLLRLNQAEQENLRLQETVKEQRVTIEMLRAASLSESDLRRRLSQSEVEKLRLQAEIKAKQLVVDQQRDELDVRMKVVGRQQEQLNELEDARNRLLDRLKRRLQGIGAEVDKSNGVLRLPQAALSFPTDRADSQDPQFRLRLRIMKTVLAEELYCFERRGAATARCSRVGEDQHGPYGNPYGHVLDAVFIEGHADKQGADRNGDAYNRRLSAARANTVFRELADSGLKDYRNGKGQPLLSLSGYGSMRPVAGHEDTVDDAVNRRIELRFLMTVPRFAQQKASGAGWPEAWR